MNCETQIALITILCSFMHISESSLETRDAPTLVLPAGSRDSFYGNDIQLIKETNPPSIYATAPKRKASIPNTGGSSAGRIYECSIDFARATNNCSAKAIPPLIEDEDPFPLSFNHKEPTFRACSPSKSVECGPVRLTPGVCYKSNDKGKTWSYLTSDTATCPMEKVDLIFLLDGSKSVGEGNFEIVKNWTSSLAAQFHVEKGQVRVGVIQYSHFYDSIDEMDPRQIYMKTEVPLGEYTSTVELTEAISKITLQAFTTYTAAALNKTVRDFKKSNRWADPSTSKVLILLTDGSANDEAKLDVTAKYVRSLEIVTFAVGVGEYKIDQLRTVATGDKTSDERVYSVDGFSGLNAIISSLTSQITSIALEGNSHDKDATTEMENSMAGFTIDSSSTVISNTISLFPAGWRALTCE